jgi:hypothetical protein
LLVVQEEHCANNLEGGGGGDNVMLSARRHMALSMSHHGEKGSWWRWHDGKQTAMRKQTAQMASRLHCFFLAAAAIIFVYMARMVWRASLTSALVTLISGKCFCCSLRGMGSRRSRGRVQLSKNAWR